MKFCSEKKFLGLGKDSVVFVALFVLGFLMRAPFLWHPASVIFDEFHFGKFVSAYCCTKAHFFDVHPPHAKLIIASFVSFFDYDGLFTFEKIRQPYEQMPFWAFRFVPILFGSMLSPLFYCLLRRFGVALLGGIFGATVILLDNGIVLQTSVIGLESFLLVFGLLTILVAYSIYLKDTDNIAVNKLVVCAGLLAGLTVGSKITGLASVALGILIICFEPLKTRRFLQIVQRVALYFGTCILIYLLGWVIHFAVLDQPGKGDKFYKPSGSALVDSIAMQKVMYKANANLKKVHKFSSPMTAWPKNSGWVYYWGGGNEKIYFSGNFLIWWSAAFGFLIFVCYFAWNGLRMRSLSVPLMFCFIGFMGSYLPYSGVKRVLFMYHYLPPLFYLVLFVCISLEETKFFLLKSRIARLKFAPILAFVLSYFWLAPYTYGFTTEMWGDYIYDVYELWK